MKSKTGLFFLGLFLPSFVFSIFVDNPCSCTLLEEGVFAHEAPVNIRIGYHADIIGDQRMRVFKNEEDKFSTLRMPTFMQIFSFTLNVKERADLSIFSGSDLMAPRLQMYNHVYELKGKESFFVAGGAKILVIENKEFSFGVDAKYLFFRTHIRSFYQDATPVSFSQSLLQTKEWQITPAISYKTGFLIPYFGVPCRFVKMQIRNFPFIEDPLLRLKALHKAGICLGVSISSAKGIFLNLEGRWLSENAFTCSSEVRF